MSLIIRRIPQDGEAEDLEEVEELEGSEEAGQETGEGGSRGVGGAYLKPCKMCKEECVPFFKKKKLYGAFEWEVQYSPGLLVF
jgi:hypothetical protein